MAEAKAKKLPYKPPAGMRKVETGINGFFKPHKPGDFVSGIVGHRVEVQGKDGLNVFYTFLLADDTSGPIEDSDGKSIDADGGLNVGVGGKTLLTFLEAHVGQKVQIFYTGMGVAKKGRNAPKLYDCYEVGDDSSE